MLLDWQKRAARAVRSGGAGEPLFRDRADRIHLYRDGYWLRVSESLRDDLPLTERLLGAKGLEGRMKEFLALPRGYEIEIGEVTVAFAAFLRASEAPALDRAVALDLLAVEARRAPEVASGLRLGLHPSVRFLAYGERSSILWRDPGGDVLRERVSLLTLALLARFREPVAPENIAARLAGLDLGWQWLQQTIEECTEAGILVHQ